MRIISITLAWATAINLVVLIMCGGGMAEEFPRFPVPITAIYPGDLIKDEMIVERAFTSSMPGSAAFVSERPMIIGHIARRLLLPGQMIPLNAVEEQKVVTRGNVVRVVVEDGAVSIVTYGTPLQSGTPGALIQVRNLDTGVTIRGIVQPDGSVRIQNG
jgi:flagella basal body P-ring formation protein FlgA